MIRREEDYSFIEKKDRYKTSSSIIPNDTDMANEMLKNGYKLIQIVPRFFNDGGWSGYTYWFEKIL